MPGRVLFGLLLIVLGIGYLLQVFRVIDDFTALLYAWWPLLIIIIGVNWLAKRPRNPWWPLLVTAVGVLILLSLRIDDFALYFWPIAGAVALLVIGMRLLLPHRPRSMPSTPPPAHRTGSHAMELTSEDQVRYSVSFNSLEVRNTAKTFHGGTVDVNFGSMKLDLRGAQLSPEGGLLELRASFGGIEVFVPDDWVLVIQADPAFGACECRAKNPKSGEPGTPILTIWCFASFGGVVVDN